MKPITGIVLLALLVMQDGMARDKKTEAACAEVKAKIRNIEARMRSGYTHAQGERYKEKLRELKARRYKLCR